MWQGKVVTDDIDPKKAAVSKVDEVTTGVKEAVHRAAVAHLNLFEGSTGEAYMLPWTDIGGRHD